MPRVHRIASLLKRWLLGTHQGAVAPRHLPYYLDEFTFRFSRRKSKSRGKLFFRLMQQAVSTPPATYDTMVKLPKPATQPVGERDTHLTSFGFSLTALRSSHGSLRSGETSSQILGWL